MLLGTVLLLFQAAFPFFGAEARAKADAPAAPGVPATTFFRTLTAAVSENANESPVAPAPAAPPGTAPGAALRAAGRENAPGPGKVIMLVVDALSVVDFTGENMPNLRAVTTGGAVGIMSTRTAGPHTPAAAHLTIGAGARARAGSLSGLTLDADEPFSGRAAASIYATLVGAPAVSGSPDAATAELSPRQSAAPATDAPGSVPPSPGSPADAAAAVLLGVAQLQALGSTEPNAFMPGALALALAEAGLKTAAVGNADVFVPARNPDTVPFERQPSDGAYAFWQPRRHGALIAMDERGRVPFGRVGTDTLTDDPGWPFGYHTDYDAVWDIFVSVFDSADLIVVELGDLARLDTYADWLDPREAARLREETVRRIDGFIGRLAAWAPSGGGLLLLVSPSPPADALRRGFLLAPVAAAVLPGPAEYAGDGGGPALITSDTTRRAGIVTNLDIAPTAVKALGADGERFAGTVLAELPLEELKRDAPPLSRPADDAWSAVRRLYDRLTLTNSLRGPVVRTYVGFAIAVFLGWIAWTTYAAVTARRPPGLREGFLSTRNVRFALDRSKPSAGPAPAPGAVDPRKTVAAGPARWTSWWRRALLLLMAVPLAVLLLPLFEPAHAQSALRVLALLTVALTAAPSALRPGRGVGAFVALALVTAAALVLDTASGARLIKNSILGYDPIVAARFYGIGNEYMGVLIGTALIGTTGLLDAAAGRAVSGPAGSSRAVSGPAGSGRLFRILRTVLLVVYAGIVFLLASPSLGANVGGTVAAVVAFGTTALLLHDRRLTGKTAVALLAAVALAVTAAALVDVTLNREHPSHLGRAFLAFLADGWEPVAAIAARKLSMNVTLLRWTIWAQVFVVSLAVSAAALYRPVRAVQSLDRRHPNLLKGIRGGVVGALAALVANDSGVVAAATLMIPVTATLMYLYLLLPHRGDLSRA